MREVFRPVLSRALAAVIAAGCAVALVVAVAHDGAVALVTIGPWLVLAAGITWACYWQPQVALDQSGVEIVNVLTTVELPWEAVTAVDTRWSLTFRTARRSYSAWAVPAPRPMRAATADTPAASAPSVRPGHQDRPEGTTLIRSSREAPAAALARWQEFTAGGGTERPAGVGEPVVRWHGRLLAGAAVVAGIGVAGTIVML